MSPKRLQNPYLTEHAIPIPGTQSPTHFAQISEAAKAHLDADVLAAIEKVLPIGWAQGGRYSAPQWVGPEKYC